jgi:hypothetical protein
MVIRKGSLGGKPALPYCRRHFNEIPVNTVPVLVIPVFKNISPKISLKLSSKMKNFGAYYLLGRSNNICKFFQI